MGSQVVGNLISAFVLGASGQVVFVIIMLVFLVLSTALFFFLRKPHIIQRESMGIHTSINQQEHKDPTEIPHLTLKAQLVSIFKMGTSRRMGMLMP